MRAVGMEKDSPTVFLYAKEATVNPVAFLFCDIRFDCNLISIKEDDV